MTDKEIIEIDGINVLECEHYQYKSLKDCEMRYPESGDCEIGLLNYLFDGNLDMEKLCKDNPNCYFKQLSRKTAECEELKKEIINKNEKIKELRLSVSDLTNRLCYLNAEKSFRIVDLEQALDTVSEYIKDNCNSCQGIKYGGCEKCELKRIEDIISKVIKQGA